MAWALAVPLGLLAAIKLVAWTLGKGPAIGDLAMAGAGIPVASVALRAACRGLRE